MIGNDVIDLALTQKESNWKRKGFLDKIFTAKEQLLILNSKNPETMVWNLWSRKEAAYKIYNRQTQIRAYIPMQLECFDLEKTNGIIYGKVICYGKTYFTKTVINPDSIETIAVINPSDFDKIKYLNPEERLHKNNGIPNYFDSKNQVLRPVSKSHHGRFEKLVTL
ncbi:4'-phosphopantetheinyl transferase family protein [Flavobacterium wongokense]|uniref:4'-phosphopantetheinyl transferase family protein n=1 Tax=Flavobacterium wongokense TaxID=2910674 RepID=UPI001F3EACAA|nr:4'-phosphopantetheinyl transferase superfamily protein [Flavobacterium sp. WG47]